MEHTLICRIHLSDLNKYLNTKEKKWCYDACKDNYWLGYFLFDMKREYTQEEDIGIKKTLLTLMGAGEIPQTTIVWVQS